MKERENWVALHIFLIMLSIMIVNLFGIESIEEGIQFWWGLRYKLLIFISPVIIFYTLWFISGYIYDSK